MIYGEITTFYRFNTNPRFPPFLLYVRCKSGVSFVRRCFRDVDRNHVTNLRKMTDYTPNLDLINVNENTNVVKLCPFILKVQIGNKVLTTINGLISVTNLGKTYGQRSKHRSWKY